MAGSKAKKTDGGNEEIEIRKKEIVKFIEELGEKAPPSVRPHLRTVAPFVATAWIYVLIALPYVFEGIQKAQELFHQLPEKIVWASIGFLLCFCGGVFPATIAAVEAWRLCGGNEAWHYARDLWKECQKIEDANQKDKADVATMEPHQLVRHKMGMAMATVDPEKTSTALAGLYKGWVGVLAILKIQFARTVTLGEVIGQSIYKPVSIYLEPTIESACPTEYKRWVPVATRWTCKVMAISFAWFLQRVVSAFHSAIRGGLMFGRYLVEYLHEKEILPESSKNTYMDEVIGWAIAFLGFMTQLSMGFSLPFLFQLFLWPLQLLEAFVVYSVGN
eukprot:TRINITY_DN15052_c0_g2_i1.p1 TRINITY_DN15052_c0_g2~~TRINITY_DN15052_c0_g2_i1.p1  ORF type:complete len:332 (-),score=61.18 TRINITY_DN15052_c0_g2_i1:175-1170(-)